MTKDQPCTDVAAQWCPVHGTCTCEPLGSEREPDMETPGCPLHDPLSVHADRDFVAVEP